MLTAADVEQKTFSTALRGYDLDEVDDFLDEVVATIKGLTDQIDEAKAGQVRPAAVVTPAPAPEPEPAPEPITPAAPGPDEAAIGRAILAAQAAADRLMDEAQSEASRIVDEAKGEAETLSAERDAKRRETEAEISALAARVASVRAELSVLAGEVGVKLDEMDAVIDGASEPGEDAASEEAPLQGDEGEDAGAGHSESMAEAEPGVPVHDLEEMLNGVASDLQLRNASPEPSEDWAPSDDEAPSDDGAQSDDEAPSHHGDDEE